MEWYGKLPEGWEMRKIKFLFSERIQKGFPNEPLLVASQNMGVVPKDVYGSRTVEAMKDLHLLKLVETGDFVISLRSFQGGIEYAYYKGIISPAYTVMKPNDNIHSGYFRYLSKSKIFIELLQLCVTGIREGQNIDYARLKNESIPLPPLPVQTEIVRYLDGKVSQINKLIEAKRQEISLLQDYKRGLIDEELSFKNELLKEKMRSKLKKVLRLEYGKSLPDKKRNVKGKYPVYGANGIIERTDEYYIDKPSLIIGRKGSAGEIQKCIEKFWPLDVTYYAVFDQGKYDIDYLFYLLLNLNLPSLSKGVKPGLNRNDVYEIEVYVPCLYDQRHIVERLDTQCGKIDHLISGIERQVALLGEYKTRLVSDVVTGKVAIQDIAAQESKEISQQAKIIEFTPKQSEWNEDVVMLTVLVNSFGTEAFPFTAFDCQKCHYLLRRRIEGTAENYLQNVGGVYNKFLKYEVLPLALEMKYIRKPQGRIKGFVTGEKASEAITYFSEKYGDEPINWMVGKFRYLKNRKEELELLTTVDWSMVELRRRKVTVTIQTVKNLIQANKIWRDKLKKPHFSDENIIRAIEWSYKHFGNN